MPKELIVLLIAALPIIELRGAIPVALGLGFSIQEALLLGVAGNILPVPFILLLLMPLRRWAAHWPLTKPLFDWVERKVMKRRGEVEKYGAWGLLLFVAIPLPGTGAWTGAGIAAFLGFPVRKSFPAIALGVIGAGLLVGSLSYLGWLALQ